MKYTIEKLPQSEVAIQVEVDEEEARRAIDRAVQRLSRNYRIPGFRPGKAPRYIVEAHFGRAAIYDEAAEDLARQIYPEILQTGQFEPVGRASLQNINPEPFSFRLIVPTRPTIRLGDYRTLRFPLEISEVTEDDVQHALEHLQAEQTIWKEPEPLRPARPGDMLTIDLVGRSGEREIERRQQVDVRVGEEEIPPGFEALIGAEVGQTLEIATTLPPDLEDADLAGQPAMYTITVRALKEPEVPPLDDDFARTFSHEQSLEELGARLRRELKEAAQKSAREKVLDQMMQAIIDGAEVEMPRVMVDMEAQSLYEEQEERLRRLHVPMHRYLEWINKTRDEYREQLTEVAPARLRRYLVLQELIQAEGLQGEPDQVIRQLEQRLLDIASGALAESQEEAPLPPAESPAPPREAEAPPTEPAAEEGSPAAAQN